MVVASGTVFNQVLLWRLLGSKEEDCVRVNITLKGHEVVSEQHTPIDYRQCMQ